MKARDLINILSYRPDAEIKIVPHHPDYTKESFSETENFAKVKEYHKTKGKKVTGVAIMLQLKIQFSSIMMLGN